MARILVAEDNANVRHLTARMLASAGHECTEAEDGREALVLARHARVPFDVIVSDIDMPHLSGTALLDILRNQPGPPLRFILISGAWVEEDVDCVPHASDAFLAFLAKPFRREQLCRLVERALAA